MNERAGYKPGRQLSADAGLRYAFSHRGDHAEPEDSGQRMVFASPGTSWNFAKSAQLYAFVQLPVYQSVNGVQLTAGWSALAGASWRF